MHGSAPGGGPVDDPVGDRPPATDHPAAADRTGAPLEPPLDRPIGERFRAMAARSSRSSGTSAVPTPPAAARPAAAPAPAPPPSPAPRPSPAPAAPAAPVADRAAGPSFTVALRGYDRRQVDRHLATAEADRQRLRVELEAAERRCRALEEYIAALEAEHRPPEPGGTTENATGTVGYGPMAERLVRMARHEAATVRATAAREAAELLEQARSEADAQRRRADGAVANWVAVVHQDMAERMARLEDQERAAATDRDHSPPPPS